MRCLSLILVFAFWSAAPVAAQDGNGLRFGRLFTNDALGDRHDRWRSGSYVLSGIAGTDAAGGSGAVTEYRLRTEIISPGAATAGRGDRPYVAALSLGAHRHYGWGDTQFSLGGDVVAIGPQTGLPGIHEDFHDLLGLPAPRFEGALSDQIHLSGTMAVSHTYRINQNLSVRPFAEALVGVEDIVRVGGDLVVGSIRQDDLMLRDVTTGQLYPGGATGGAGISYVVGADLAAVGGSQFLPPSQGYQTTDTRARARAGVHLQTGNDLSLFYGMTYLSEEFEGQEEGQLLGSFRLNFNF